MEIIHIVLGKANPNRMNGVNKVVYQLATNQANNGKVVSVWGFTKDTSINYEERAFKTKLFQSYDNLFKVDNQFEKTLLQLPKSTRFHLHGGWIPTFHTVAELLTKHGFEYVITPHGAYNTIAMQKSKLKKKIYFQCYEKYVLRNAKAIHCIGKSEVEGLGKLYDTSKVQLLPYGFELEQNANNQKTEEGLVFGFLGRLDIYTKGLDLIMQAFAKITKTHTNCKLWIIGDSNERTALEELAKQLGVWDRIVFWGAKYGKEKDALLKQIDIFLHPSRNEGLPSSVLEAASFGIPSIVTEATNVGSYIEKHNAGICIKNENVEALAEAMEYFLITSYCQVILKGENAKRMLAAEFSWSHIVEQFDAIYA